MNCRKRQKVESSSEEVIERCILTRNPLARYTFKWSIENCSYLPTPVSTTFEAPHGIKWKAMFLTDLAFSKTSHSSETSLVFRCLTERNTILVTHETWLLLPDGQRHNEQMCHHVYRNMLERNRCWTLRITESKLNEMTRGTFVLQFSMTIGGHCVSTSTEHIKPSPDSIKDLSEDFKALYENHQYADIKLQVGRHKIPVHRAVLCARSPVFAKKLLLEVKESSDCSIVLFDFKYPILRAFLRFLYSGEVKDLDWDKACALYSAADKYEVYGLRAACVHFFVTKMTADNVHDVLRLARAYQDEELDQIVQDFVRLHESISNSNVKLKILDENVDVTTSD